MGRYTLIRTPKVLKYCNGSHPCRCGSGNYCHRHRAYGLSAKVDSGDLPTFAVATGESVFVGRRRMIHRSEVQ